MDTITENIADKEDVQLRDVIIIGAGPVGLFAVFQCGMMGMDCHVIDALPEIGGQCTALYPEKPIYDIPAFPAVDAGKLIKNLAAQAAPFNPQFYLNQQVVSIIREESYWQVKTSANKIIQSRVIIIAAGAGAFGPNRPPLENIKEFEGRSVFYMVGEKKKFKDKNIVIAGGGDSAVDWAIALSNIVKSVHIVHRRDKFRAMPESLEKLQNLARAGKIKIETPYQLHAIEGQDGFLHHVLMKDKSGNVKKLDADILLPFYGLSADLGPIKEWNLDIDKNEILVNPTTAQTNINGIYAIGDIATYRYKKKFILTGFSEAAFAAQHIAACLYPERVQHFEYSTTKGVP